MIYVGPEAPEDENTELAHELPFDQIMTRSCAELEALGYAMQELESLLVAKSALVEDGSARKLLQSIDPIQQSLQALAGFMGSVSNERDDDSISIHSALKKVHLETMRKRLGSLP